jgi:hypothetical protein
MDRQAAEQVAEHISSVLGGESGMNSLPMALRDIVRRRGIGKYLIPLTIS